MYLASCYLGKIGGPDGVSTVQLLFFLEIAQSDWFKNNLIISSGMFGMHFYLTACSWPFFVAFKFLLTLFVFFFPKWTLGLSWFSNKPKGKWSLPSYTVVALFLAGTRNADSSLCQCAAFQIETVFLVLTKRKAVSLGIRWKNMIDHIFK